MTRCKGIAPLVTPGGPQRGKTWLQIGLEEEEDCNVASDRVTSPTSLRLEPHGARKELFPLTPAFLISIGPLPLYRLCILGAPARLRLQHGNSKNLQGVASRHGLWRTLPVMRLL